MNTRNKLKICLIILASVWIMIHVFVLQDYNNLSWEINGSGYLGIIGMSCVIFSMLVSMKNSNKNKMKR